ncbi:hypothetical protein PIB30_077114 [Stylosanthes scabra]|uniref:Uncharacterized protein n=1 Tax=Stylosanthes scabra TaxID=79078 RepID=A0ABU6VRH3_9FABA|nr:hypothetical protein [Stylosanthes scabra]
MVQQGQTRGNTRTRAVCKVAQPRPCCCPNDAVSILQVSRGTHNPLPCCRISRLQLVDLLWKALILEATHLYKRVFSQEMKQGERAHQMRARSQASSLITWSKDPLANMGTHIVTYTLSEGQSSNRPPLFTGKNYPYLKE